MPKITRKQATRGTARHNPLHADLTAVPNTATGGLRTHSTRRSRERDDEEGNVVPAALSRKILQTVEAQHKEIEQEIEEYENMSDNFRSRRGSVASSIGVHVVDDEGAEDVDPHLDEEGFVHGHDWTGEMGEEDEVELDQMRFRSQKNDPDRPRTLADLILEKIREKEMENAGVGMRHEGMSQKVTDVYKRIGEYFSKYKSGKIPKAFKAIPRLTNWEEVLVFTAPEKWTPNAMEQATKLFASNLNAKMAQRFYNLVLLPAVRDDIATHKKLNYHYYQALRKAVFKPAAFIKGILLPVAEDASSMREAVIIGSVVAKVSIPADHGAAALIKMCETGPLEWTTTTSYLMGVLINKKWALPGRALSAVVDHFHAFATEEMEFDDHGEDHKLPVVWHRCLLSFVQKYKYHLSQAQTLRVKETVKANFHKQIGTEIRREIGQATQNAMIFQSASNEIGIVDAAMGC
eukprot:GHVN01076022.1.p1 GENE.GHVN01076022.1~~GHVN01076022.1.p1  ORF type:complete len:470 (+),score=52.55 GHVN01076022.1:26-1411(+)